MDLFSSSAKQMSNQALYDCQFCNLAAVFDDCTECTVTNGRWLLSHYDAGYWILMKKGNEKRNALAIQLLLGSKRFAMLNIEHRDTMISSSFIFRLFIYNHI